MILTNMKSKFFSVNYDEDEGWCVQFPVKMIVIITGAIPIVALIFCITWSLMYYFEDTTSTECKNTWNFLPSISSAIGNNLPQYIVWCSIISLLLPSRFLIILLYYRYNSKLLTTEKQYLVTVTSVLSLTENLSLLGLSYISSSIAYIYHKNFFLMFVAASELYMLITCLIHKYASKSNLFEKLEIFSFQTKIRLLIVNALSFVLAIYCFFRHHFYCEPGVYSLFAFFEITLILSNVGFHSTAAIDFKDQNVCVNKHGIEIQ